MAGQPTPSSADTPPSGRTTPTNTTPPPEAQFAANNTPVVKKASGYNMFASVIKEESMAERYKDLVRETRGHYIGPMPVQTFLDDFLPWNPDTPENYKAAEIPASRIKALKSMVGAAEAKSYQKFVRSFVLTALNST